jgi:hypothetical protein
VIIAIIKGDTIVPLLLRLRGIDLAYTETKRNRLKLILSISRIGFALFLYYPIPLILSII